MRSLELACLRGLVILTAGAAWAAVPEPVLKWQLGGCYAGWCETGWYSSPAVADLDGDGAPEVIASGYSIVALDGATGTLVWRVASGHDRSEPAASSVGRTWPGIVVADLDGDGLPEIATAHGGGWVSVYEPDGYFAPGWPVQPTTAELRGLSVADVDGDGTAELLVTAAQGSSLNAWLLEHSGAVRDGWPQRDASTAGSSWGVYNDTSALADLDGDGLPEVLVPSDVHYACAYQPDGTPLQATAFGARVWGEVGLWVDPATEALGYGSCDGTPAESWRTNFADGPATVADLDGDGTPEIVLTGRTYDCTGGTETTLFTGVYVLEPDRSRFANGLYDWTRVPVSLGAPLSLDYNVIENAMPNSVVADLDGDGTPEILFADFAGKLHAFWLDGTEHGSWPFVLYDPDEGFDRLVSEPVVADLDSDGSAEVVAASWTEKGSGAAGRLLVLAADGTLLWSEAIPMGPNAPTWGGALEAPTLADIDGDGELEAVLETVGAGVVAYDLPGSAGARVQWATGRGSFRRAGTPELRLFADGFEWGSPAEWSAVAP